MHSFTRILVASIVCVFSLYSSQEVAPAVKQAMMSAHKYAQTNNLRMIEGSGKKGKKGWMLPAQVKGIVAGGGGVHMKFSDRKSILFAIVSDDNLLSSFSVSTKNNLLVVKPHEGLVLSSQVPVALWLLVPNGCLNELFPLGMNMGKSERVFYPEA